MSGLLQRLAARATGSAWTVRSDARLPFAAPVAPDEPSAQPLQATDATAKPTAPRPSQQPPGTPSPRKAEAAPANELQRDTDIGDRPSPIATRAKAAESQPLFQPQAAPAAPMPATPTASAHLPPASFAPQRPALATASRSAPAAAVQVEPPAGHRSLADPPALMPTRDTRSPQQRTPALSTPPPRTPAATPMATATEVHVHIGRIEVTALQAPAARPRPARERTQPVSLDAYLAKKKQS